MRPLPSMISGMTTRRSVQWEPWEGVAVGGEKTGKEGGSVIAILQMMTKQ